MNNFAMKLTEYASKISANKYLGAVKDAFIVNMPFVITGSFAVLFANVICSPTTGLAQFSGFEWLEQFKTLFDPINYATMNIMALSIAFLIGSNLGKSEGQNNIITGLLALTSYVVTVPTMKEVVFNDVTEVVTNVLTSEATNAQGLFLGILVSILSVKIYAMFMKNEKIKVKMPENVPPNIAESFSTMFPIIFTLFIISGFTFAFEKLVGMPISAAIFKTIQTPLHSVMQYPIGILVVVLVAQILWSLGLHGANITSAIRAPLFMAAITENMEAVQAGNPAPNIVTTPFWAAFTTPGGSGATLALIFAIFLFSKMESYKTIAKLSIAPGIFNINEPIIFGIPMVLNPIMMIPFIVAPLVSTAIGYFGMYIGFAAKPYVEIPWTTPPFLNIFLATGGDFKAVILQAIAILATFFIYLPFVFIANKQADVEAGIVEQ